MKSNVLPSFGDGYRSLEESIQRRAEKAHRLWAENPFHPSLHFKCINTVENIWSVRVTRGYRALGVWESDIITWFWIGSHADYERFFS
ncbi:MAG: hypothetical protein HQK60_07875 [Deltaproteobacteria bacterium]|nr:hypothetical protein [Deltaproteobacteria bacterium]